EIAGAPATPSEAVLARVVASGALALPCFSGQGGPFAARKGAIRGTVAPDDLPALATLYCAVMTDLMLTRLGAAAGDLIVEGSLAANPAFGALLAALRPAQSVLAATDAAGAARGAALLAQWPDARAAPSARRIAPAAIGGLGGYREAWTQAVVGG
ncbi:MAG: sugar kinase, partial [Roseiarcus sp.]